MSVMDLLQAGGGGVPSDPAAGGGGIPPELLGALHGGSGSPGGSDDLIRQAIDVLQQAAGAEQDEQDIQTIMTCITNLQGVLANNQKDSDAMLGGKASPKALRRATAQAY